MYNIIIGKRSNLSKHLSNALDNCILISSDSIESELNRINWSVVKNANLILNQFQPSNRLYDISSPIDYISNSILSTALILDFVKIMLVGWCFFHLFIIFIIFVIFVIKMLFNSHIKILI